MYIYVKIFLYGIAGKDSITNKINKCPDCSRGNVELRTRLLPPDPLLVSHNLHAILVDFSPRSSKIHAFLTRNDGPGAVIHPSHGIPAQFSLIGGGTHYDPEKTRPGRSPGPAARYLPVRVHATWIIVSRDLR